MRFAVIIPAYRPTTALVELVRDLAGRAVPAIVVVDDGSGREFGDLFAEAAGLPRVHVIHHAENLGKGAALKTGFQFALASFPDLGGVVTADADGQHHPDDIERVAAALAAHADSLVLGSRAFAGPVPLRSRAGNAITRGIVHLLVGRKLGDTQTGLRGIPAALLPQLLRIDAAGYEFELEMLMAAHQARVPMVEEPVRTIYEPGNRSSHFNPIVDSMKIYFVLLRFTSVSLMTAALDNLVFYLIYRRTGHILESQIGSRLCALVFQYTMLRRTVFHSRQRHGEVLPKFVALLVANGAISYGAIRWATGELGLRTIPAKLAIETLLFFGNFLLQRGFVFRARPKGAGRWEAWRVVFPAVLAATVALEIFGCWKANLFSQTIWFPGGYLRFLRYLALFLTSAIPILFVVPWTFVPAACALAAAVTAFSAGPLAVLAPVAFLISACALGSRLMGRVKEGPGTQLTATLLGIAVYIFLMTLTARLPIHYAASWAVILALPMAADWPAVKARMAGWRRAIRGAELRSPAERGAAALLAFVLGMHWLVVLQPEVSGDGLAVHLAVPANIAAHHAYTLEPARIAWAAMPLGADWTYSIVYLLGGELGARLLNFGFLLLMEALVYRAVRQWLSRAAALLVLAAVASTPIAELVTGSLFVENLVAVLVLGTMLALWRFGKTRESAFLYASATLAGTALAAKFGAFAVLMAALPFAILEARQHLRAAGVAVALFLTAATPTYAIAWWKTGNPVFPYLNSRFHSALLPAGSDFRDLRFAEPLGWRTPFDLTFFTHRFYEGQDGSFGFHQLFLLLLAVAAVMVSRRRQAIGAAVVGVAGGAAILASVANVRYLYPVLPLLAVAAAATLAWMAERQPAVYRAAMGALAGAAVLNIWFLPSGGSYNKDFYLKRLLTPLGAARALDQVAPYRALVRHFHRAHPNEPVLLTWDDDLADVAGDGYPYNWHSTALYGRILATERLPEMARLMRDWKIRQFIGDRRSLPAVRPEAMRQLLAFCTLTEYESRGFYYAKLDPACENGDDNAILARIVAPPLKTSAAGWYDDFDPAIRFEGEWTHSTDSDAPYLHTISYGNDAAARAELAFEGRSIVYLFAKAPDRGMAEVAIDGERRGLVDLYSPRGEWRCREEFCCFAPGRHVVTIRAAGRRNAAAMGDTIDLDGLIVKR